VGIGLARARRRLCTKIRVQHLGGPIPPAPFPRRKGRELRFPLPFEGRGLGG
jgi:hypothetical protein